MTLSGVIGSSLNQTPMALCMALPMAAGVGVLVTSAPPRGVEGKIGVAAFHQEGLDGRHVQRGRQPVLVEVGVEHLSGLSVVDPLFGQGVADPDLDSADDLGDAELRIDRPPEVLRGGHPDDGDLPGLDVHLDFGGLGAEGGENGESGLVSRLPLPWRGFSGSIRPQAVLNGTDLPGSDFT